MAGEELTLGPRLCGQRATLDLAETALLGSALCPLGTRHQPGAATVPPGPGRLQVR